MAVPRNRHSNARKNSKRAHHAKTPVAHVSCRNCNTSIIPHHLCPNCGYYRGMQIIKGSEKTDAQS